MLKIKKKIKQNSFIIKTENYCNLKNLMNLQEILKV